MDAFENVVSEILWRDGYWVQTSFKVELTKEEKQQIERPSSPRWEIDVIGFNAIRNELIVVECKSYLDSAGVDFKSFDGSNAGKAKRFKLFNDEKLRVTVFNRISKQLLDAGLVATKPKIILALVCGKIIREADRDKLKELFSQKNWLLLDDIWLRQKLQKLSEAGYENSMASVVAKLLLRK
jgi:hypothetical protein